MKSLVGTMLGIILLITSAFTTEHAADPGHSNFLSDCSTEGPPLDARQPDVQLWLSITKGVARPGEEVVIRVEGDLATRVTRGVDSYLECWNGYAWVTKFVMVLNTDGGTNTPTVRPYSLPPTETTIRLGLHGPGPEPIRLPQELRSGWYRIRKEIGLVGPIVDRRTLYVYLQVER